MFGQKLSGSNKILVPKLYGYKKFWVQNILGKQNLVWSKGVNNSWDIPDMDKCRQDNCPVSKSLGPYSSKFLCLRKKFMLVEWWWSRAVLGVSFGQAWKYWNVSNWLFYLSIYKHDIYLFSRVFLYWPLEKWSLPKRTPHDFPKLPSSTSTSTISSSLTWA